MAKQLKADSAEDAVIEDGGFGAELIEHIRAGYQCLYVPTSEESRAVGEITRVTAKMRYGLVTWDVNQGFRGVGSLEKETKFRAPLAALHFLLEKEQQATLQGNFIFIFKDLDDYFHEPQIRRALRTLTEDNRLVSKDYRRPMLILSARLNIPEKLKTSMSVLEMRLPSEEKLLRVFDFIRGSIETTDSAKTSCSDALRDSIIACLLGLTATEAENALSRCLVRHGGFCHEMLATIKDEKAAIVRKGEVLTYIKEETMANRNEIGGFDLLMSWLDRRRRAYEKRAQSLRIDHPKGIVLLGVPGTGKSYVAKAVAKLLGLPGYIMDVGAIFGHLVGESEQRMRDVIHQIEAQQGCVLLVDEADKAFGGAAEAQGDSGVTRRVFGKFLTWLSEKQDRTFVIMTMNRTRGIPPEFLRAGRFDAVWYTDLPHTGERKAILDIQLRKRGVDPDALEGFGPKEWKSIVERMLGYVGSEIEEVVREARYLAYENRQSGTPTFDELFEAAGSITPMSERDKENIEEIRTFCKDRARPVTTPESTRVRGRERPIEVDN